MRPIFPNDFRAGARQNARVLFLELFRGVEKSAVFRLFFFNYAHLRKAGLQWPSPFQGTGRSFVFRCCQLVVRVSGLRGPMAEE